MDETTLDLFRRIFDELLDNPLPDTVTVRNAPSVIPVLIDSMAGQATAPSSTSSSKSDFIPKAPKKSAPVMNTAVMRNQIASLTARTERLIEQHRAASLQSRVNELLGGRKRS